MIKPCFIGPVCGTDDKTYSSECALETASCKYKNGVEVAYPGNCVIPLIPICKTVVKNENNPTFRTPAISDTPLGMLFLQLWFIRGFIFT